MPEIPDYSDVLAARGRIAAFAVRTPLVESPLLGERINGRVFLKLEFLQRTGSFKFRGAFNDRQDKVIARMFREGIDGFKGGLSAENYITISKTSRATATRDLHELVETGALRKNGELRHTRYHLNLPEKAA